MSYDFLRKGRFSATGYFYHSTIVTAERRPVFADFASARHAVREMQTLGDEGRLKSVAWVLMPDHLHWLFQLNDSGTLGETIRLFKGRSARRVNSLLHRQGPLWQRAFYDHALRAEEDLRTTARYIVANPLRAGIVDVIGDYPHWDAIWL